MASAKKAKAVSNTTSNPYGLTNREVEIMIHAWRCLDEAFKIDKKKLAELTKIPLADSAGRSFRRIMEKITSAMAEPPTTPGNNGDQPSASACTAADAAVGDPSSPSVLASDKKNSIKKKGASVGKTAGRKRALNEADEATNNGDEGVEKNESNGDERPNKIPRIALGNPIVTVEKIEAADGGSDEVETGDA
ncbi:hypothetical protein DHEL01_v202120 [Diaporthe helianthi]|uniref:Uncharacterized protein n=1 Tax=Diaporthe helianthi TaxID=158607 RepID=A0A2P5IAG7_DIAHE|nr:hypothetical protein DHEL01_v202120 [Diaporthe helianthi]